MQPLLAFVENPFAWLVILVLGLLVFGHKLPGMARSLGQSVSEFKKGAKEGDAEQSKQDSPPANPAAPANPTPPVASTSTTPEKK